MANALYKESLNNFLTGEIDWVGDSINVVLVDTDNYQVDIYNDSVLNDIPEVARVSITTLEGRTASKGIANAEDAVFENVEGEESEAVVIYKNTGDPTTSYLIAYIDTADGLPVLPNSGNINVRWPDPEIGIFAL